MANPNRLTNLREDAVALGALTQEVRRRAFPLHIIGKIGALDSALRPSYSKPRKAKTVDRQRETLGDRRK